MRRFFISSVGSVELSIIGAGRTGRTLGLLARRAGYRIGAVVCRTAAHARQAAGFIGAGRPGTQLRGSALTIIAVPDGEIPNVVRSLKMPRGGVAAHTCASLGAEALRPLKPAGALHPLRSFADPSRAAGLFPGTSCAIDGDPEATSVLEDFVRAIGGVPLRVRRGRKALYHAGAVFASNYVIAVLESALRLLDAAGVPRPEASAALLKLAEGTLENVRSVGIPEALTGPIERGDRGTVSRHVAALLADAAELYGPYASLGGVTVDVALAKGTLDDAGARAIHQALVPAGSVRKKATARR
jgi:predicted short-subunit dehydrogenase-like oxidoreductase (DUF2520 family)